MLQKIFLDKRVTVNGRESVLSLHNFINLNAHIVNVISASLGSLYSFSNGLTLTGNAVTWGGTLTGNTGINAATFDITFTNADLFSLNNTGSSFTFDLLNITLDSIDISLTASDEVTISAINSFNLLTPNVNGSTANTGALLQLINNLTGDSEYTPYTFPLTAGVDGDILQLDNAGALQWVASDAIVVDNTLFVMENGSDVTGLRTRFDKPFATIQAAMAAATVQDTVIVYPGNYTATTGDVVLVLGVKLKMEPGATLNITTGDSTMFEFGSGNGIYGQGTITINNALTTSVVFNAPNADTITLECDTFISSNFSMHFFSYGQLSIKIGYLQLVDCTLLSFNGTENMVLKADINKYVSFGSSAHINIEQLTGGSVDININSAIIGDMCLNKGFLYTESCDEGSSINVTVNRFINNNTSDSSALGDQALVTEDRSFSTKRYVFNYLEVYGRLYEPIGTGSAISKERGYMKFVGKVKTNVSTLSSIPTWINFTKRNQYVTFDLDMVDETTEDFGTPFPLAYYALLNITSSSFEACQYVTGRISTERTNGAAIIWGVDENGPLTPDTGKTATLVDFAVVTASTMSFADLSSTPIYAAAPARGCVTNVAPDPSATFSIETPITDVNVI